MSLCAVCLFDGRRLTDELDSRIEVIQKYEDQLSEAVADLRELRNENKALRIQWLRAKSILNEFMAWHETGARIDSLQLDRIRDMTSDLLDK